MKKSENHQKQASSYSEEEIEALRYMVDASLDMICSVDLEGRFVQVSKSCKKILGYTPDELTGQKFMKFVHPEDQEKTEKVNAEIKNGLTTNSFENRYLHKNGKIVPIIWSARLDKKTQLIYCVAKDATAIKKLQFEKESERQNKETLLNVSDRLIWSFNKEVKLIEGNIAFFEAVKTMSGLNLQKGDNLIDANLFSGKIHLQPWTDLYQQVLSGKEVELEFELQSCDNEEAVWVRTELKPILHNKEVLGGVCQAIDITTRKLAEKKIEELNIRLKEAQKIAKLGYWELNLASNEIYWSEEVYRIWEIQDQTIKPNLDLFLSSIHPEDKEAFLSRQSAALSGKQALHFEHRIKLANGEVKWVLEQGMLHENSANGTSSFKGTVQDITQQKLAEEELKKRNEFIENIFQHLPIGISVNTIDDGQAVLTNQEFSKIYGWPQSHLQDVSSFFKKIFPDAEVRAEMIKMIMDDIESGDISKMQWPDVKITCADGSNKYIDIKNIPLARQNLMISTAIDVTAKRKNEEALQIALNDKNEILESISDAFLNLDQDFNFTYINEEAQKLLSITKEQAMGHHIWHLLAPAVGTKIYDEFYKAFEQKKTRSFEYYYPPLESWFNIKAYPAEHGLSVFFRNINHEKRNRQKLNKLNTELKQRARDLEQINKELEQFAFIASHDLQEPLRMVSSFMSQLKNKYGTQLDEKANTYIDFAVDGASRMRQIIKDLLEYSRAGSYQQDNNLLDMNLLLSETLTLYKTKIQSGNAKVISEKLPLVYFNKTALLQVLQNLIGNALKYSDTNKTPEIRINYKEEKLFYEFSIIDNGIGIKEEFLDKIFIIFQRLHTRSEYTGAGLGLAICKKIIEKAGGSIWAKSVYGQGSEFHFTIPKHGIKL